MRVIGGIARGHRLYAPSGMKIRPISDKVKESLFNIIAPQIVGAKLLDLYAGVGNVGIEALSRGAKKVFFVDKNSQAIDYLKSNLKRVKLEKGSIVLKEDVSRAISTFVLKNEKFDLIFLDPPYKVEAKKLNFILDKASAILKEGGIIILSHSSKKEFSPLGLKLIFSKKYGDTTLSFYKKCGII